MADANTETAAPTAAAIARAIAIANGHPDPDTFVTRFEQALDGKAVDELPDYEPAADPEQPEASEAAAPEAPAAQPEA